MSPGEHVPPNLVRMQNANISDSRVCCLQWQNLFPVAHTNIFLNSLFYIYAFSKKKFKFSVFLILERKKHNKLTFLFMSPLSSSQCSLCTSIGRSDNMNNWSWPQVASEEDQKNDLINGSFVNLSIRWVEFIGFFSKSILTDGFAKMQFRAIWACWNEMKHNIKIHHIQAY